MSNDENLKFKASPEGVELEVSGDAGRKLGTSLADAISPFTESLGAVGDEVRRFHIHREEQAKKTLIRAQEIRAEREIENQSVSPKLLAPWLEGASLEDDSGENISETWARLLAECPSDFSADYAVFIDILSRLGKREAETLERYVPDHKESGSADFPGELDGVYLETIENNFEALNEYFDDQQTGDTDAFTDPIFKWFNEKNGTIYPVPARATYLVAMKKNEDDSPIRNSFQSPSNFHLEHGESLVILEHSGLVSLRKIYFRTDDESIGGYLVVYELTSLGKKLLRILHPVYSHRIITRNDAGGNEIVEEESLRHK
ncbi:MAG: hypothetical protein QNJ09_18755 [Paracoccaceae bacterium]|nr:hypothetical protein [Paracoccaceae bacterium]